MNAKEIIVEYLKKNGFDGLANEDCGCGIDNLCPCGEIQASCSPAKKVLCSNCKAEGCCCRDENEFPFGGCYFKAVEICDKARENGEGKS